MASGRPRPGRLAWAFRPFRAARLKDHAWPLDPCAWGGAAHRAGPPCIEVQRMRGTFRIPPAAHALVDGAARMLAVLGLLHALAAALLPSYDPRWLGAADGPVGWRVLLVLLVLFATAMLVVRPRVEGGVVVARAAGTLLATACLVDALARFRIGRVGPVGGPAVPLTLLLAAFLYLWVLARRAPTVLRASGSEDRLWHKMLERARP